MHTAIHTSDGLTAPSQPQMYLPYIEARSTSPHMAMHGSQKG